MNSKTSTKKVTVTKVKGVKAPATTYATKVTSETKEVRKQMARNFFIKYAKKSKLLTGLVLTLPFIKWEMEEKIVKEVSNLFRFLACECGNPKKGDIDTSYKAMVLKGIKTFFPAPSFQNGKIGEILLSSKANSFAHILLDYCGCINEFVDEIKFTVQNDIVQNDGVIFLTFSLRDSSLAHKEFMDKWLTSKTPIIKGKKASKHIGTSEAETIQAIKNFLNVSIGEKQNYLIDTFTYGGGNPMAAFVLHRRF